MNCSELKNQEAFSASVSNENDLFSWDFIQPCSDDGCTFYSSNPEANEIDILIPPPGRSYEGYQLYANVKPKERLAELLELEAGEEYKIVALLHPAGHLAFCVNGDWLNFHFTFGQLTQVD